MVGFFEHQYLNYRKTHFKNLIALAKADHEIKEEEIHFLLNLGKKFGLKRHHLMEMMNDLIEYEPEVPTSFIERMEQLFELVGLMLSDDFIDRRELAFVDDIRQKYRISPEVVDRMIEMVKHNFKPDRKFWVDLSRKTGIDKT